MNDHFSRVLVVCAGLALGIPARAAEEQTWTGYLWRNRAGELQMGSAIIAMSTLGSQKEVVGKEVAASLNSLVSDVPYPVFFWNYQWLEDPAVKEPAVDIKKLPKVLVRLRGKVATRAALEGKPEPKYFDPFSRDVIMTEGRLLSVEYLNDDWLKGWQNLARLGLRYGHLEGDTGPDRVKDVAPKVLKILKQMRAAGVVTAAQREATAKIDDYAKVGRAFQAEKETRYHRWLLQANKEHRLELAGLADVGDLPPEASTVQKWFLAAKSKAAFFETIRGNWKGELDELSVSYYWSPSKNSTVIAVVRLDEMRDFWSAQEFERYQEKTKATLRE
jgi:hypothetical protein